MFVPPLESVLRALGTDRDAYARSREITLPKATFEFLVSLALQSGEFNEAGYLAENADVAKAVRKGEISDTRAHYVGFGYFEGRTGGTPTVDEDWYLSKYPDVALAIKRGNVASAHEHYNVMGGGEGRSPSAAYVTVAETWKKMLVKQ